MVDIIEDLEKSKITIEYVRIYIAGRRMRRPREHLHLNMTGTLIEEMTLTFI